MGQIEDLTSFLKRNFALIIVLVIVLTPPIWMLAGVYYEGRIATLTMERDALEKKTIELESKKEGFKKIALQETEVDLTGLRSN